jgi:hypothetical protein
MRIASCVAAGMELWVTTGISGGALAQCADKLEPIKNQYWLFPAWFEPSSASLAKRCPRWQGRLIARTNRAVRLAFAYCALTAVGSVGSKLIR